MSFTTDVEIVNLALAKMGAESITAALLTTPGSNEMARKCSKLFEPERDALMGSYPWHFAMRRAFFDVDNFYDTITGTTAASPVVVTGTDISAAYIEDEIGVYITDTGIEELDHETFIAKSCSNTNETLQLYELDRVTAFDGSAIGTATTGYIRICPILDYSYMFKLPSNILKIWNLDEGEEYTRERDFILTNYDEFWMEYIYLNTTVSEYSEDFIQALAYKLAAELSTSGPGKDDRKAFFLEEYYKRILPNAIKNLAVEVNPSNRKKKELSSWQKAGR